jgi:hypothetical protein
VGNLQVRMDRVFFEVQDLLLRMMGSISAPLLTVQHDSGDPCFVVQLHKRSSPQKLSLGPLLPRVALRAALTLLATEHGCSFRGQLTILNSIRSLCQVRARQRVAAAGQCAGSS